MQEFTCILPIWVESLVIYDPPAPLGVITEHNGFYLNYIATKYVWTRNRSVQAPQPVCSPINMQPLITVHEDHDL